MTAPEGRPTLMRLLRDRNPKAGDPLTATEVYAANMIGPKEWERIRLQQKREGYLARKRAKEELAMDVAAIARGEKPRRRYADGVPTAASQLAAQEAAEAQVGIGFDDEWGSDGTKNV